MCVCVCVSEREREVEIESKMLHNTSNTKQIKIIQFAGQKEKFKTTIGRRMTSTVTNN